MMEISQDIFDKVYNEFILFIETETETKFISFRKHPFIEKHENYKFQIKKDASLELLTKTWKPEMIGSGKIFDRIKKAIKTDVIYNYQKIQNNLIDWRKKDDFSKINSDRKTEQLFFDFFKNYIPEDIAFNEFKELSFSYQLIAYIFFLKNSQKYLPISQERFDFIFQEIGIDFKTSGNCNWENYVTYNKIIKSFKEKLKKNINDTELLDAHSFLWIWGWNKIEKEKNENIKKPENSSIRPESKPIKETKKQNLYEPIKLIESEIDEMPSTEIDYIEKYKNQIEIGKTAEKFVFDNEYEFLSENGRLDLAEKIRDVSFKPQLGFDILSYELNGEQKQIEVKAVATANKSYSFYLTKNELDKSKKLSNYYLYCVINQSNERKKILRIKQPDFENDNKFNMKPETFRIRFK